MLTISKIDRYDLINNPMEEKPCITVWFSGCSVKCDGCHNTLLWDKSNGNEYEPSTIAFTISSIKKQLDLDTVVFLGGEPLEQDYDSLIELMEKIRKDNMKIWLYTSHEIEDISDNIKKYVDTIKCGKYNIDLHVDGFPSSSNQRLFKKNEQGKFDQIFIQS